MKNKVKVNDLPSWLALIREKRFKNSIHDFAAFVDMDVDKLESAIKYYVDLNLSDVMHLSIKLGIDPNAFYMYHSKTDRDEIKKTSISSPIKKSRKGSGGKISSESVLTEVKVKRVKKKK